MSGASILLVEDDPEICELVVGTLRMEGHEIDAVHEGADLADRLAAGALRPGDPRSHAAGRRRVPSCAGRCARPATTCWC